MLFYTVLEIIFCAICLICIFIYILETLGCEAVKNVKEMKYVRRKGWIWSDPGEKAGSGLIQEKRLDLV